MSGGRPPPDLGLLLDVLRRAQEAAGAAAGQQNVGAGDGDSSGDGLGSARLQMRSGPAPAELELSQAGGSDISSNEEEEDAVVWSTDPAAATIQPPNRDNSEDISPKNLMSPNRPRDTVEFYDEHRIDPSSIAVPEGPVRDEGASIATLLEEDTLARAVNIAELHMERTTLMVRRLLLVATIVQAPEPTGMGTFGIRIRDAEGDEIGISIELDIGEQTALEYATSIAQRFTVGTSIAVRNFILGVVDNGFFVLADCKDADSEVFCCGSDTVPGEGVAQLAANVDNLMELGQHRNALNSALGALQESRGLLLDKAVPVMTNLAVSHWKLGYKGVALAYALGVCRLVAQGTPCQAAVIASKILSDMKCEVAQHVIMIRVDGPDAAEAGKDAELMLNLSKAVAQSSVGPDDDPSVAPSHFRCKGLREAADALIKTEKEWKSHCLGEISAVETIANQAREDHGAGAVQHLYAEGNRLFSNNWISKAILQWRAAIWLLFNRQHSPDVYYLWDILDSRAKLWDRAGIVSREEAFSCHYLDLATIAMLRAQHVNVRALSNNITLGRCKLGRFHSASEEVVNAVAAGMLSRLA